MTNSEELRPRPLRVRKPTWMTLLSSWARLAGRSARSTEIGRAVSRKTICVRWPIGGVAPLIGGQSSQS